MATLCVPEIVPSPVEDADELRSAMEGWGTDEKKMISILAHRNAEQRKLIREAFADKYGEDFLKYLESELSRDFLRLVYLWTLDPCERDAMLANEATQKWHPSNLVLVEISCTRSPDELMLARKSYKQRFKSSLEEDVAAHTNGSFRKLVVNLVSSYRYDGPEVHMRLAKSEAKLLQEKICNKEYDDAEVIRILSTRSKTQLCATFNQYIEEFGHEITEDLNGDSSNEFLGVLSAVVTCLSRPEKYFEGVLRNAIEGWGTDEEALSRVVATRSEVDMQQIKEEYFRRNSVSLHKHIVGDTSWAYKDMLLALVGN